MAASSKCTTDMSCIMAVKNITDILLVISSLNGSPAQPILEYLLLSFQSVLMAGFCNHTKVGKAGFIVLIIMAASLR